MNIIKFKYIFFIIITLVYDILMVKGLLHTKRKKVIVMTGEEYYQKNKKNIGNWWRLHTSNNVYKFILYLLVIIGFNFS